MMKRYFSALTLFSFLLLFSTTYASTSLVPRNSVWKYLQDGTDQGTAWQSSNYDDSTWNSGLLPAIASSPNQNSVTTYLRKTFVANDTSSFISLRLNAPPDAGLVAYLNGKEIYRANMPTGPINYRTQALPYDPASVNRDLGTSLIKPSALQNGNNTLAVEIHSQSPNLDLALTASNT
ncbi:MAG: hypothetical protein C5B54_05925, partial [Acidobacteria bacterium]